MSRRATDDQLDELHAAVASILTDELKRAKEDKDEKGGRKPVPSTLIQNAMRFLKDNGVDAPAKSERLSQLAQELADIDLDETAGRRLQ